MKKIEALQRRLDEVERKSTAKPAASKRAAAAPAAAAPAPAPATAASPSPAIVMQVSQPIPGLPVSEPMSSPYEDALRSDLPGLSLRIPGASTEIRFYGMAKASSYTDFNGRNQTHASTVQSIPLRGSPADLQGGDTGMTARFSRIGFDTRTPTGLGTLETRIEGDFASGPASSNNLSFRLRQAWGELGTDSFRVLIGQANSLWNEGMFETLNDAANLNQSFVRQAQLRLSGRLAPGLTGYISLETPDTQATSEAGIFMSDTNFNGSPSPAFNAVPDLLGRLNYRNNGLEIDTRGVVRNLSIRTPGTGLTPPLTEKKNTLGWGVASHVRFPMRWLSESFGPDELIGMAYYGEGIGRYFTGNTSGQDLIANIGLPGVGNDFVQEALPTYGGTIAYRRFWTPQLRSNLAYSYAKQDYPAYAYQFTPGSGAALSLNSKMEQAIVNLIWSPFATVRNGRVDPGWVDAGLEYIYSKRDVYGGMAATTPATASDGSGVANRLMAVGIVRF